MSDIARLYTLSGKGTPEDWILHALPHLTQQQVQAALSYWHSHTADIDAEIAEECGLLDRLPAQP